MTVKMTMFWVVTLHRLAGKYHRFGEEYFLHLQVGIHKATHGTIVVAGGLTWFDVNLLKPNGTYMYHLLQQ
jgi:hypothetical protein